MEVFKWLLKAYYGEVDYDVSCCSYVFSLPHPPYVAKLWILGNLLAYTRNDQVILIIVELNLLVINNDNYYYGGIIMLTI